MLAVTFLINKIINNPSNPIAKLFLSALSLSICEFIPPCDWVIKSTLLT